MLYDMYMYMYMTLRICTYIYIYIYNVMLYNIVYNSIILHAAEVIDGMFDWSRPVSQSKSSGSRQGPGKSRSSIV